VALARALVNRPQVLLLDEPLGALDLKLRKQMQIELKLIQHDVAVTFIHVTHDQEEAMTMADRIAVMNAGRIEQLGTPDELYERPRTRFVAGFLGVSNLISGSAGSDGTVRADGVEIQVTPEALAGRSGRVAVGIRPEKILLGEEGENRIAGTIKERAYIGVSTQYIVDTSAGELSVYVQNAGPQAALAEPGDSVVLSWSREASFVVDDEREGSQNDSASDS
jgi:spermidine/putrescine transport system ATP-binding protein